MKSCVTEPLYTISEAAEILNISVHTLRMYEREGLIVPFRKESNHRLYSHSDIERLICIRNSINIQKLSIAGIQTVYSLIPCWDIKQCEPSDREKCEAYVNHSKACWMFKNKGQKCSDNGCRNCIVYNEYADCGKIKESIIKLSRKNNSSVNPKSEQQDLIE